MNQKNFEVKGDGNKEAIVPSIEMTQKSFKVKWNKIIKCINAIIIVGCVALPSSTPQMTEQERKIMESHKELIEFLDSIDKDLKMLGKNINDLNNSKKN